MTLRKRIIGIVLIAVSIVCIVLVVPGIYNNKPEHPVRGAPDFLNVRKHLYTRRFPSP